MKKQKLKTLIMYIYHDDLKNKGITLIALVITIIILLILAGITLSLLQGENGIITKAKEVARKYENAQDLENEILESYENIDENSEDSRYLIGQEIVIDMEEDYNDCWHICDGTILKKSDYPKLAEYRSDLVTNLIDYTPIFSSPNSRVKSSGTADGNWPAFLVFSPNLLGTAGSGWISQGGQNLKWISVDMEENTFINKMEITNINHQNRTDCVGAPIDFTIKGSSDDITYDEIINITGNEHIGMGETYSYSFNEVSYRYYKIEITNGVKWWDGNDFYGFRFWKLILDGDFIKLPNNPTQIIKIK